MTETPYPVSGLIRDTDGSTVVANAVVTAWNATKGEQLPGGAHSTTNSVGEFTIDLANFPSDYSDNDVIFLYARNAANNKIIDHRFLIDTALGSTEKSMDLHHGSPITSRGRLISLTFRADNAGDSVTVHDRANDAVIQVLEATATASTTADFGSGIPFQSGVALIYTTDTANSNQAFAVQKDAKE